MNRTYFGFNFLVRQLINARITTVAALFIATVISTSLFVAAVPWNNLEPLKSRRADVERALGRPLKPEPDTTGVLEFQTTGGIVKVAFVNAKFIQAKKLSPELEGAVLQIVLQHTNASDTPESLKLVSNGDFTSEEKQDVVVYRNTKDGIAHTFISGKLKTSHYTPSLEQFMRAQKKS